MPMLVINQLEKERISCQEEQYSSFYEPNHLIYEEKIREVLSRFGEATFQEIMFGTCIFSPKLIEIIGRMVIRGEIAEAQQQDPFSGHFIVSYTLNKLK